MATKKASSRKQRSSKVSKPSKVSKKSPSTKKRRAGTKKVSSRRSPIASKSPSSNQAPAQPDRFCGLPIVQERVFPTAMSSYREMLIRYLSKHWVNGTELHYYLFASGPDAGSSEEMDFVREGFDIWRQLGIGIRFTEVASIDDAEIRIGFRPGDGSWSYVGRDSLEYPGQQERTMNFGWPMAQDPRGVDVAVHEIGHALGFPHEHQNPFAGIVWDEEAVYRFFGGPPNNWSREATFHNVLRKLPAASVEGSEWDADSIMHYAFPGGLILEPPDFRGGIQPALGLSDHDVAEVKRLYPPIEDGRNPKLDPFELEMLSLEPGEQRNYRIEPEHSRKYTIQTVGQSDTVLVLFEDDDGELRYLSGDDDSGTDLNAEMTVRLLKGKKYVLRARLYFNFSSGDTAILLT